MKISWCSLAISAITLASPLTSFAATAEDVFVSGISLFSVQREDLHVPGARLATAILDFTGARNEEVTNYGHTLLSGCRAHSCTEKGAAIVDLKQRRVLGIALLHYHCHVPVVRAEELEKMRMSNAAIRSSECEKNPTLSIHMIRKGNSPQDIINESQALETLEKWGGNLAYERKNLRVWQNE